MVCLPLSARIAQLVERGAYTSVVLGSSPSARTGVNKNTTAEGSGVFVGNTVASSTISTLLQYE
jgi:hypothetical protein